MMNEYLQGVSILPWFNPENRVKALKAALKAEDHLWILKENAESSEIYWSEKRRMNAQIAQVTKLWNKDMDEWLANKIEKAKVRV